MIQLQKEEKTTTETESEIACNKTESHHRHVFLQPGIARASSGLLQRTGGRNASSTMLVHQSACMPGTVSALHAINESRVFDSRCHTWCIIVNSC